MKKFKKIIVRTLIVLLIIIPVAALAHFLIFPQETRCILIDHSNFKKDGRLYYANATAQTKIDTIKTLVEKASNRIAAFWGQKTCDAKFIYCDNETDFKKYGSPGLAPAVTHTKLGSYVVLSNEGVDLDIIAHEISHAEFYERRGFFSWTFKIPMWFKQGLAMQCDLRDYYSEDILKVKTDNYKNLPDVKLLKSDKEFYNGSIEQVVLNYMAAKHEVKNWYSREKLNKLIADLNSGKSFKEAFGK